jgi:hypothetical protein
LTLATNTTPKDYGAIQYSVANVYIPLDKDIDIVSSLKGRDGNLSLSFSSADPTTVASLKKALPSHLTMTDSITNLSPIYLSLLGDANDEFSLILSMSCTATQVANIPFAGDKAQCTDSQMNDWDQPNCACCMLTDEYIANASPSTFKNCNDLLSEKSLIMSKLSLLAYYDGGIPIKNAGDSSYDGSGTTFTTTLLNQTSFYSGLIQRHTVRDLMFGYPSALIGSVVPLMYMAKTKNAMKNLGISDLSSKQVATELLTGAMDRNISFPLGDLSKYTRDVGAVCHALCSKVPNTDPLAGSLFGSYCKGTASDATAGDTDAHIALGGIDCMPYSATYATVSMCSSIDTILLADPTAPGYKACSCVDGSQDWKTVGCCLAGGQYNGIDLTASGCLYPVAGSVDNNYLSYSYKNGKPSIDVGAAIHAWTRSERPKTRKQFMCPADGVMLPEHKTSFGRYEAFDGVSQSVTFYQTSFPRIRQGDLLSVNATAKLTAVSGSAGQKYFNPTGYTAMMADAQISNGHWFKKTLPLYIKEMKGPLSFSEDWSLRPIVCGADPQLCLFISRFKTAATVFQGSSNTTRAMGTGLPYNGLQAIGHFDGPSLNGRPAYINQPNFLAGDSVLFTQQTSAHVDGPSGNGILLYRPKDSTNDPGAFVLGGSNTNYSVVNTNLTVALINSLQSYLDLEPSTGLGVRSKLRLGQSYSIWECDPESNSKCHLDRKSVGKGKCYSTIGASLFASLNSTKKSLLVAANETSFSFPCSAANVFSPNVIGGKIMPLLWYEDARKEVDSSDLEPMLDMSRAWLRNLNEFIWFFNVGFILATMLGPFMLLKWLCFAPKKQFLLRGPVHSAFSGKASSVASTTTSQVEKS